MSGPARKVIIDCDPGIDDAIALCLALFEPSLEILAVTSVEGCVSAHQANRNVQAILEQLDPQRLPRLGAATPAENAPAVNTRFLHGDSGLGSLSWEVSELHHQHPSEKVIADIVRANPGDVTIIALGPLTNIARAFQRDPGLVGLIDRLIIMGGSMTGVGNITASAEFNIYYDPQSARSVFRSKTTKTLIPLDITRQVVWYMDLLEEIPDVSTRAGRLLRGLLPYAFRSYRQQLGQESIQLNDVIAMMAAISPELIQAEEMAGDVEIQGELTQGMTIFDRRPQPEWSCNMEVATVIDVPRIRQTMIDGLKRAGRLTQ